jgi:predicted enzyme related to lactoylglutathione lyase
LNGEKKVAPVAAFFIRLFVAELNGKTEKEARPSDWHWWNFHEVQKPGRLYNWYEENLGLKREKYGAVGFRWRKVKNPKRRHTTVWSIFPSRMRYFCPTRSTFMINYCVADLGALLTRLRRNHVWIDPKRFEAAYGRFAWIRDRDGNRIELWEPSAY